MEVMLLSPKSYFSGFAFFSDGENILITLHNLQVSCCTPVKDLASSYRVNLTQQTFHGNLLSTQRKEHTHV